jgi:predicted nucleic acid-binding protein
LDAGILLQTEEVGYRRESREDLEYANLHCPEASLLFMALDLYVHANIDFVDAYNAVHMKEQGLTKILTYDRKHFARIPWVQIGDL